MKKLITIMAAAASALFAFGDVTLPSGTSVELYTGPLQTDKNDAGTSGDTYWYLSGDNQAELLVTNYEGGVTLPTRPVQFAGQSNDNYLKIDTQGRLYRSIGANEQDAETFPTIGIGDGIYLDTLVQFTPAEDAFGAEAISTGDKIAIEYVENEGYTNFVVRAGYVSGSSIVATNYFLTLPGQAANEVQFDKTAWHRLTVRAISNVGNANAPVGFVVYVDGVNLVYDVNVAAGDQAYVDSLNSLVKTYIYNSEKHALLPSLLRYGETGYDTLSAVAFNGNGCVDDISFTATQPTFIVEGTAVTIAWDANVATYTVVAGEDTLINAAAVFGAGSTNLLLDTSVATLTVTATYGDGYTNGVWTASVGTLSNGVWTDFESGATLTINSMLPLFQVGETQYGTFGAALTAAVAASKTTDPWTSVTIKALADIDEGISFTDGDIVLDLNGKTLQGTVEEFTINNSGAILTIIDSASGGTVLAPSGEASRGALYMDDGATVINGGLFEGHVITQKMDEEAGADDLTLNGGVFFDDIYDPENVDSKFYLYAYLGDGVKATYNEGYFTVGTPAPEPTTYAISWTLTGGTTEATAGDFEENDTIVFTAESGKTLSYVEIDGVEDTSEYGASSYTYTVGTADAELVVTFTEPAPTTYEVTWTLTGGTTTATSGDDFEENDTIVFTAESGKTLSFVSIDGTEIADTSVYGASSYTYTVGTADAELVVTFTAESSYPSYIPEDAAVKAKYDSWSAYAGVTPAAAAELEDAFLLNCLPAEVDAAKAAFKITSISYDTTQAKWVVTYTDGYNERKYNGTVTVKQYSDVGCKTESATGTFFKATLDL